MSRLPHILLRLVMLCTPLALLVAPLALLGAPLALLVAPLAVHAQSGVQGPGLPPEPDPSVDAANLAERILVAPREPRCADTEQVGGITVCGKKHDNSKDRLPIVGELNSATATGDGVPRAPDTMGNRITGHSIKFGCMLGGCPQAMLPEINFSLLPPDPLGSDADRIGKGEIRGN